MQQHISTCSGQAGFNFSFDNGRIINYQDNYKKIGDLLFALYYDFETTAGSVVFFDAKMYVVSYCIIVAFHPDLNIPRLYIYRSYDQDGEELTSLVHFETVQQNFFDQKENFNPKTLAQLRDAALAVENRKKKTALEEMFSVELKFTVHSLKFWFNKNKKVLETTQEQRLQFVQNSIRQTCCLCDFPLQSRADNGWFQHTCKAEHLFLENIYSAREMYQMGIAEFDIYFDKLKQILDKVDDFCASLETENRISISNGKTNPEINEIVKKIKQINTSKKDQNEATKEKTIGFLYKTAINFLPTDKISGDFPMSARFLQNMIFIHTNQLAIHHSHVTGKIIGYAHKYCNLQIRENYYMIPVIAHNQFRFDFFLFLKGLKRRVGETTDINIGGKNPADINFAIVQNQVRFIDTVKYYQQSLASLASSIANIENENVRKNCRRFLAEKLMLLTNEEEKWVLVYLSSGKGLIPYQIITDFASLKITPQDDFFEQKDFYSSLKEKDITAEEYENVKNFFTLLRLKTLEDMNRIYNFQDTLILCEIFEQRASLLEKLFKFNPRKCNSASSFSRNVHRNKSKCNISCQQMQK